MNMRTLFLATALCLIAGFVCSTAMAQSAAWVVKFEQPGLLENNGSVAGFAATRPVSGEKLDSRSPAAQAYLMHLEEIKNNQLQRFSTVLNRPLKPRYHYRATQHGLLLDLTAAEAQLLRAQPGVVSVAREPVLQLDTDRGPTWIGATQMWDGSTTPDNLERTGKGMVVGIIDSGINSDHPAFAEVGPVDGYIHENPNGAGNYIGHCIGSPDANTGPNAPIQCNNKLIGAWAFTNASDTGAPEDTNGHGTHTASTTASNILIGPFFNPLAQAAIVPGQISGVAPHANVIAYDVCEDQTCSATSAGIDQAIIDGVDAINFSISGGTSPWNDNDRLFLDAVDAGIFVAASAGNTRDNNPLPEGDVNHRGPWVMTVAASTHDRDGTATLFGMSGGMNPPADITGASGTDDLGQQTIVYAGDFSNGDPDPEQCLNPFPAGTWTNNEIVLCDRGTIARVLKGVNVAAGGAGGLILANVAGGNDGVNPDFHVIPGIHVNIADGNILRNWLATGNNHSGAIDGPAGGAGNPATADVLAGFSLRGPNLSFDVTKPDITNPGVSILAAVSDDPNTPVGSSELDFLSGTSMSSPHTAGAAALVMEAQPDWSVMEVKSAMQLTADQTGRKEDNITPVTPDDVGNGRVDLTQAALSGLIMNETFANFLASNPATGGDPRTLNLPSMRDTGCDPDCSWTRVVKSGQAFATDWTASGSGDGFTVTVTPSNFSLLGKDSDVLFRDDNEDGQSAVSVLQRVTIQVTGVSSGNIMTFGNVLFTEDHGITPDAHMTIAVSNQLPVTPP